MIKLRQLAAAFIFNGDRILLMKRADQKGLFGGLWAPVGGHLEPDELNDPRRACLREIEEEIGLTESDFSSFEEKYVTVRRKANEIRIQYLYIAATQATVRKETDEGELHWINLTELFDRPFSTVNESALKHYFKTGKHSGEVFVGVVNVTNGAPVVTWEALASYDSFY